MADTVARDTAAKAPKRLVELVLVVRREEVRKRANIGVMDGTVEVEGALR